MIPAKTEIETLTLRIEQALHAVATPAVREKFWITHYGANHLHPKHLVYWICVHSDAEKKRLEADSGLMQRLRGVLDEHDYPLSGRSEVHIGFESQETVDRQAGGNWWHHWK